MILQPIPSVHYLTYLLKIMPFWLHSTLMVVSYFVGAIFGVCSSIFVVIFSRYWIENVLKISPGSLCPFAEAIIYFSSFIIGSAIPLYIFTKFIPTRCPICKSRNVVCNLNSPGKNSRITYHCKFCGHLEETPLSLNG